MHLLFQKLIKDVEFTGNLEQSIHLLLSCNNCPRTAEHCMDVGKEARRVAEMFNVNPQTAEIVGWLLDISAVFPNSERILVSRELEIENLTRGRIISNDHPSEDF